MTLRALLILVVGSALIISVASISATYTYLEDKILALFPTSATPEALVALNTLLVQQAAVTAFFSILLGVVALWVVSRFIARPLQKLSAAMQSFVDTGSRVDMPTFNVAPKEIKSLATSFSSFLEKVEESHKRDVEISRVKSDFISTAAHQLRTPLTGIRWALEALEQEQLTQSQLDLIKNAKDKSHDLVAIVGTLLDISSIESGKYKYTFAPVNISELLKGVAATFAPLAEKRQVSVVFEEKMEALPPVKADIERVKWVLNNLVENAIQYTPAGGSVKLQTDTAPGRVYIQVKDTGIGIKAEDQGNIFERFYRAGNAIAKENKGNGLGLYIARTIAQDHGGDLNFSANQDGPGTTFTLSLPSTS
ncbi:HAMP domain-containing histidine kinase [Patescibacteria group bacterium]|nr:HAMP domain-containing histidine kinase [Patescibacteria group bacterium]MBU1754925.1 HAMP domain-containing histidine kinase [Patescibacteria group bacterium]